MLNELLQSKEVVSSRKIEKLRRELKLAEKVKLRAELPVLTLPEIRRCRLPYYETIIADLTEAGYQNSVYFIKQLFQLQEQLREQLGEGSQMWQAPHLIRSNKELDILSQGLSKAEEANNKLTHGVEWDEMLALSAHFAFGSSDWWWIGEQLLSQCIAMDYPGNYEKELAIANYLTGKFLICNKANGDIGQPYLETAREIAIGKSWNCKKYLKEPDQDNIFAESCKLLCTVLVEEARYIIKTNPSAAAELCTKARKYAIEACQEDSAFSALLLKGQCELAENNTYAAIATLYKLLKSCMKQGNVNDICAARIYLAVALLRHGKRQEALVNLKDLRKLAEENDLPYYLGLAYRYIGEYFLEEKTYKKATPFLLTAFYIFHRLENLQQLEEVRTLAAISAGLELYPIYIVLLKKCDTTDGKDFTRLLRWKDSREVFWSKKQSMFSLTKEPTREEIEMYASCDDDDSLYEHGAVDVNKIKQKSLEQMKFQSAHSVDRLKGVKSSQSAVIKAGKSVVGVHLEAEQEEHEEQKEQAEQEGHTEQVEETTDVSQDVTVSASGLMVNEKESAIS